MVNEARYTNQPVLITDHGKPAAAVISPGLLAHYQALEDAAALARDPEPPGSTHLSGSSFHRLQIGEYRILYDVTDDSIRIWSLGRAPR